MHVVEIHIIETKVRKGFVKSLFNKIRAVTGQDSVCQRMKLVIGTGN